MGKKPDWRHKARMYPKFGGEPLERPPIVMPYDDHEWVAERYRRYLQAELDYDDEPKWSGAQRQDLRRRLYTWTMRAQGLDPHYKKHGTFRRPMNSEPPGRGDLHQEMLKRAYEDRTGERSSSAAERRKWRNPGMPEQVKKLKKQYGTKDVDPEED